ncbi:MAG: RraA family protein [Planctomycetales bacterium]|nr:RraA family protein [Planctomycetales bacterium]MBN8624622.1 RraA family protein [Planctomycetota bacterium]
MPLTQAHLDKLAKYDTPTILNLIELFDVVPRNRGYMDARIKCNFPEFPPMVGYACTAAFRSDAPPMGGDAYGSMDKQLTQFESLPGPAVVVFQDLDDPAVAATFGEVMCSTYQGFGSAGLITSGAGRDLEQVRAIKYPVFTGGSIASHGYCHMLHLGLPVRVGGLTVNQGDLLHGDANGVARIPTNIVPAMLDIADEFVDSEKIVLDYVRQTGGKTVAGFAAARKEFTAVVAKITEKAKKSL